MREEEKYPRRGAESAAYARLPSVWFGMMSGERSRRPNGSGSCLRKSGSGVLAIGTASGMPRRNGASCTIEAFAMEVAGFASTRPWSSCGYS
eukprot:1697533-Rhodomonas_salina.4